MSEIVIIGQGPNKTCWERSIELGGKTSAPEDFAVKRCARLAITGAIGDKLAALAGLRRFEFFRAYDRKNLNARFNGKDGRGDAFNRDEGIRTARTLIDADWTRYVLLGAEVCACFGFKRPEWLEVKERWAGDGPDNPDVKKYFLLFPHPSGINSWWNESFNEFRAALRLKEFLNPNQI